MATKILGKVALTPKGTWATGTYNKYDYVYDTVANATYVALQNGVTNEPSGNGDGVNWTILCKGIGVTTDNNFTDTEKAKVDSAIQPTQANVPNGYLGIGSNGNINNTEFISVKTDLEDRGLNVKNFGASGSAQTTTGTISAGSTTLTLASAIDFQNGQGISINHAGVACALTTPTAPTVTPTGTAGTTTYQYQIVALDANGGCTAAGAAGTITTGNATLSATNYNVISWTAVTNAVKYAVYGRISGAVTLLTVTTETSFNDIGAAMISSDTLPSSAPTTALADMLITTIASGASTTSIVISTPATTSVTAQMVGHDDTMAIQNAIDASKNNPYVVYIPAGNYIVKELFIDNVHGITLCGDRSGHDSQNGSCLIYTGTADCITIKNTDNTQYSGFTYRVDIKNIAIFARNSCNSFINAVKIQESTFYNIGLWGGNDSITIQNGIILDGAGIIEIDNSTIESVHNGIVISYDPSTGGSGGINITRNNIYKTVDSIVINSCININIDKNWIEGFEFALYLNNLNPLEVTGLNFTNNDLIQSTSKYAGTEAIKVDSLTPANRLIVEMLIANNTIYMNSSGNTTSPYGIGINTASNTSGFCDVRCIIENNFFYGISIAAVYNDNKNSFVKITSNSIRQALFSTDTPKICEGYMVSESNAFIIDPAYHTPTYTFSIPKRYLANHGINIRVFFTVTANSNTKSVYISINNAVVLNNESIANISNGYFELSIIPSDLTHQELILHSKCEQEKLTTISCNYDSSLEIPITIEKTCPTQGDTVTISSIIAMLL